MHISGTLCLIQGTRWMCWELNPDDGYWRTAIPKPVTPVGEPFLQHTQVESFLRVISDGVLTLFKVPGTPDD